MLFNSLHFLVFFPLVFFLYFLLPYRFRNGLLLVASIYFYMAWKPIFILLVLLSVSIDYVAGILIDKASDARKKKWYLIVSLSSNLAILGFFKYFNFFTDSVNAFGQWLGFGGNLPFVEIILPLGISFYTFQSMSYAIDVYRGVLKPERNFFRFLLFVTFFPQMVAGPIERAGHLLGQFYEKHDFNYRRVTDGMKLAAWGLFKKVVIADQLAPFVDYVYQSPENFTGMPLIIATVFFAFQIYCDFSGYSDIAVGTAQMLGFRLMDNFNRPYFSKSTAEFWNRWHISLSSWFRDYLYIPLGGNRVGPSRAQFNLLATFFISGLWHGANWTFILWGLLNGFYIVASRATATLRQRIAQTIGLTKFPKLHQAVKVGITFSLICAAWVFFRAESMRDAIYIFTHAFVGLGEWWSKLFALDIDYLKTNLLFNQEKSAFLIAIGGIAFLHIIHLIQRHGSIRHMLNQYRWYVRWPLYTAITLAILLTALSSSGLAERQFIYFTF
jgi:alginate O-acetyltransferase complex protein AlgI